jgi:hypothetical protein
VIGVIVGALWRGAAHPTGSAQPTSSAVPAATYAINMTEATGVTCGPPVAPGPAHPDRVLAQVFNVEDNDHTAYLLGWQIVPYHGTGTYTFHSSGNLLALEPPTGGRPLGFGAGTVTFADDGASGTVQALVTLNAGGTLSIKGRWVSCEDRSATRGR